MSGSASSGRTVLHAFPTPYPGEDFLSIVWRFAVREGFVSAEVLQDAVFGGKNKAKQFAYPRRLGALARVLAQGYPKDVRELLMEHSQVPYLASCLSAELKDQVVRDAFDLEASNASPAKPKQAIHTGWIRVCPECADLDRHVHGEAYLRTVHQPREVVVCHIHGCPLVEFQTGRAKIWDLHRPEELRELEVKPIRVAARPAHRAIARIVATLMDVPWHTANVGSLVSRLVDSVRERGLSRNGVMVDNPRIVQFVREQLGDDYLEYLGLPLPGSTSQPWTTKALSSGTHQPRGATPYVLMLGSFGVNPEEMRNSAFWEQQDVDSRKPGDWSQANHLIACDSHRAAIQRFIDQHPTCQRTDVQHQLATSVNFASRWDADWLETVLPVPWAAKRARRQKFWAEFDAEATRLLRQAADEIRAMPGKPRKVSKEALLKRLSEKGPVRTGLGRNLLPAFQRALGSFCERPEEYAIRRVAFVVERLRAEGTRITFRAVRAHVRDLSRLRHTPSVEAALIEMGVPLPRRYERRAR